MLGIEETFENMEDNQVENYMMQNHIISRQVLKDFIIKECDNILNNELDSPFLNELEQDGFEKILSTFIKNASSDHNSIERLVVHAIKKYTGE